MTGPKGNSEFCFTETPNVPQGEASGNIEVEVVIPPNTKVEKKPRRNRLPYAGWLTNLPRFEGVRPDHLRVASSCYCFPRELVESLRSYDGDAEVNLD